MANGREDKLLFGVAAIVVALLSWMGNKIVVGQNEIAASMGLMNTRLAVVEYQVRECKEKDDGP